MALQLVDLTGNVFLGIGQVTSMMMMMMMIIIIIIIIIMRDQERS
jgi:hypothetical protein